MLWSKRAGNESPQAVDALHGLVINLTARKKFDEAVEILTAALTPGFVKNPSCVNTLELRLNLLGRQARWREAAVDAALIVGHQPADHTRYHALAPLLVVTGDHAAHTRLCQEILARFGHTDNPYIADRAAKDCLLRADAGTDPQKVDQLADIAVTAGKGEISMPFFQTCKALSKLRQGEFETAIEWAEKPLAGSLIYAKAHACAVLAMAHWRLGRHDEALSALGQGIRLAPEIAATGEAVDLGEEWDAWLLARIQLDEAAALIKSGSVTDNHSAK